MSSLRPTPHRQAVLDGLRALSAASDLLDAAVAQRLRLHRTDLHCLDYLARFGPVSAGRLGEAVGLTSGALTTAVDRLATAGYVRRSADQSDRRRVVVQLNKRVNRVVALFQDLGEAIERLLDGYSAHELQLLSTFLAGASEALSAQATTVSRRSAPAGRLRSRADPADGSRS